MDRSGNYDKGTLLQVMGHWANLDNSSTSFMALYERFRNLEVPDATVGVKMDIRTADSNAVHSDKDF